MATVTEIRKQASKLGIKNYTQYRKEVLEPMVMSLLAQQKEKEAKKNNKQLKQGSQTAQIVEAFKARYKVGETYLYEFAKKENFPYRNAKRVISKYFGENAFLTKRK